MAWNHEAEKNWLFAIARGDVNGYYAVNKFGQAPTGVQTGVTDIWDRSDASVTQSTWTAPTQARYHLIASTSGSDTNGGGGARTVTVTGLTSWDTREVSEVVVMNGTAGVQTENQYVIVHRVRVKTSGEVSVNVGTIGATAGTDGTVTAAILPRNGTTNMAIYGFPSIQDAYVFLWYGSINKASGLAASINFELLFNPEPNVQLNHFRISNERGVQSTGTNDGFWPSSVPLKLPGPGIIKVAGIGSASDIDGTAGFELILVDK